MRMSIRKVTRHWGEAREGIGEYIRIYNEQRLHSALDYQTPDEVYFGVANTKEIRADEWLKAVA